MTESPPGTSKLSDSLTDRLDAVTEAVAAATRVPGGGSVAAMVVALAAALVAKAGRLSLDHWRHAGGAIAQAEALRARAGPLAEADAAAYSEAITALEAGTETIGPALLRAAEIPLLIAEAAADVAALARVVADEVDPDVRPDAVAAATLAAAGAQAAAHLVGVNLGAQRDDERVLLAQALAASARRASEAALATES